MTRDRQLDWRRGLGAALLLLLTAFAAGAEPKKLAVLELRNKLPAAQRAQFPEGYYTDQVRQAALGALGGRVQIISRENLLVLLQASGKKLEECEGECEVDTGKRIGADFVISGEIVQIGTSVKASLRLHDTAAGELLGAETASGHTAEELDASLAHVVAVMLKALRATEAEERPAGASASSAPGNAAPAAGKEPGASAAKAPAAGKTPTASGAKGIAIDPALATGPGTALAGELLERVLKQVESSYYDPRRIDPRRMLEAALRMFAESSQGAVRFEGRALSIGGQSKTVAAPANTQELRQSLHEAMAFALPLLAPELPLARGRAAEFVLAQGMLQSLDPRSMLIAPQAYRDMKSDQAGQFGGIGAVLHMSAGQPEVLRVFPGTPAALGGLAKGDLITAIDRAPIAGLELDPVVRKLRGKEGSSVALRLQRPGRSAPLEVTLTRAIVQIEAMHTDRLEGGVLRIKLSGINAHAAQDVKRALADAQPAAVVLDLRGCPGGLLAQVVEVVDLFLKEGEIVTGAGAPGSKRDERRATPGGPGESLPLAVLIDAGTASGAEVLAGALRFNDRAILLGAPTAGRGTMQVINELPDGIAIKLSVAQDLLAGDRSFAGAGLAPDIELKPLPEASLERESTEPPLGSSRATLRYAAASDPDAVDPAARWAARLLATAPSLERSQLVEAALKLAAAQGAEPLK